MMFRRFIRKKQTILYILLFAFICIIVTILFSYLNYITEIINNYFEQNSYAVLITKRNKNELLKQYNSIEKIYDNYVFLEPNEELENPLSKRGYVLLDEHGIISQKESDDKLNWESFESVGKILVSYDESINANEIVLYSSDDLEDDKVKELLNSKLYLKYENNNYTFIIKDVKKSIFPEMKISKESYNNIKRNQDFNIYRITFKDETNINIFYDKENKKDIFIDVHIQKEDKLYNYEEIINIFNDWKYIVYTSIAIILIIILFNMIKDEKKDIMLDYVLGFNKKEIKVNIIKNVTISFIIILFISLVLSFTANFVIKKYFYFEVNLNFLLQFCLINFMISLIEVIFMKIKM